MLTFDQIKKYFSAQTALQPKSILVEYLQYELLDSLYQQPSSAQLSFMGGTAIRIVHQGNRFSEDLDFDNFGLSFADFATLTKAVIRDMRLKGFVVEFRLVEKGAYHCYIKFPNILQSEKFTAHRQEKILVRIDTVLKTKTFTPLVHTLNAFDIYRDILTNPVNILLAQKLITILERKRERGRDFYDVSYLYGMTEPHIGYIEQHTGLNMTEFKKQLLKKCASLNFKMLTKDVAPFLIDQTQQQRVMHFQRFIQNRFSV